MCIYQTYFSEETKSFLDSGFVPYDNTGKCTSFFENEVLIDIFKNKKSEWKYSQYVGLLSWKFKEKTNLSSVEVFSKLGNKDVYLLTPSSYMIKQHPHESVSWKWRMIKNVLRIIDNHELFPFKMYGYDSGKVKNFCNFWVAKPDIFHDYVQNYVIKLYEFLKYTKDDELIENLNLITPYKGTTCETYIFEGLFQIYCHYKKLNFEYIFDSNVIKTKAFGKEFAIKINNDSNL